MNGTRESLLSLLGAIDDLDLEAASYAGDPTTIRYELDALGRSIRDAAIHAARLLERAKEA